MPNPKLGRPTGPPHKTKSIRLPCTHWKHLDKQAKSAGVKTNRYVRTLIENDINQSGEKK